MRLVDVIDNLSLDLDQLDRDVINREIVANYSDHDLVNLTRTFLRGIGNRHTVPGGLIWSLADMADQYSETGQLSPKQRIYIIQNILEHWHQIGVEMRAELGL